MPQPWKESNLHISTSLGKIKTNAKVVAAIDFGTTFSGVSFVFRNNPTVVKCGAPGASVSNDTIKVPTVLLQRPEGWLFGQEAIDAYNDYIEECKYEDFDSVATGYSPLAAKGIHLYRFFKLRLKDQEKGALSLMSNSTSGRPFKLIDLIAKSLGFLADYATKEIQSGFGSALGITKQDILWVITVPAIWNDFGKSVMRKAACRAGLVADEASERLLLALEPECASIAMQQEMSKFDLFKEGSTFLVLDCGGGTVDCTLHHVASTEPLVLDEVAPPTGGAWGGIFVDREFHTFLKEFVGEKMMERVAKQYPNELEAIQENFRQLKVKFGSGTKSKNSNVIDFSGLLVDEIRKELGLSNLLTLATDYNRNKSAIEFDLTDKVVERRIRRDSKLTFSDQQIRRFFEPTMTKICNCVKDILDKHVDVSTIVLVGGYGASEVLRERVVSQFQDRVQIINPKHSSVHPQAAIVHGAAHYGLYTSVIGTRIAKKTYGIRTNEKWFDGCRFKESDAEWDTKLAEKRVKDVFSSLVKKDARIKPGETFQSCGYSAVHSDQTSITFEVFQSDQYSPMYTTKNCKRLGEVEVPCRSANDKFDVQFTFGADIRVEIIREDGDRHFTVIKID